MKLLQLTTFTLLLAVGGIISSNAIFISQAYAEEDEHDNHDDHAKEKEQERGPNNGKLFRDDDFSIELIVYEQGVPPEFRVYVYEDDELVDPAKVQLNVELSRL